MPWQTRVDVCVDNKKLKTLHSFFANDSLHNVKRDNRVLSILYSKFFTAKTLLHYMISQWAASSTCFKKQAFVVHVYVYYLLLVSYI